MGLHNPGDICDGCDFLLEQVHPYLSQFYHWVKDNHPEVHIAQAWRGEIDQNKDFASGKSHLKWPDSKHNHIENGKPCSLALDLFQLIEGEAKFDMNFYNGLYNECVDADLAIRWGGTFKDLLDGPHFEILADRSLYAIN